MAQIRAISGKTKKARMAKIIHKKKSEARILFILLSKNRPKIIRNRIISPWLKNWISSFMIVLVVFDILLSVVLVLGKYTFRKGLLGLVYKFSNFFYRLVGT